MTKPRAIHYAGELVYRSGRAGCTHVSAGFAACSYGDAAWKVRREGNHSYDRKEVTCKRCLACLAKELPGD